MLAGLGILIDPEIIYQVIEDSRENESLYIIAISVRIVFGISLFISAKETKYPLIFKVIGVIAIVAAITFILIGPENFQDLVTSIMTSIRPYGRIGSLFTIAFGGFLIYAFKKKKNITIN